METFPRKKLEIVIEASHLRQLTDLIENHGAKGYTILPTESGKGLTGERGFVDVAGVFRNFLVMTIAREPVARAIMADIRDQMRDSVAILSLSDVEVARDDHF